MATVRTEKDSNPKMVHKRAYLCKLLAISILGQSVSMLYMCIYISSSNLTTSHDCPEFILICYL